AHGDAHIGYIGQDPPPYFNMSVNGVWVIQNIPLLPHAGIGVAQDVTMFFDLASPPGTPVSTVDLGWSIDPTPIPMPPHETGPVDVKPRDTSGGTGRQTETPATVANPTNEFGDQLQSATSFAVHGVAMPNQDCGVDECGPVALSNSKKWLQKKYGKPPKDKDCSIDTMKKASGWSPPAKDAGGNPIPGTGGVPVGYADNLRTYMNDNGYQVTTTEIPDPDDPAHDATAAECASAMQEIKNGQDVEVNGGHHVAVLTGMAQLANGTWVLYVAHDTDQGNAGGTRPEKIIYDPATGTCTGGAPGFFAGDKINGFVVECPAP
ncbi:MAG: hypothetical protein ABIG42_02155, partial [bacterium]